MNFSRWNLLFAIAIAFIAISCDELFQLNDNCTTYVSNITTAASVYEMDPTVENCQNLEAAVRICVDSCSAIDPETVSYYEGMLDTLDCSDIEY